LEITAITTIILIILTGEKYKIFFVFFANKTAKLVLK